jgi:hypothetical protein
MKRRLLLRAQFGVIKGYPPSRGEKQTVNPENFGLTGMHRITADKGRTKFIKEDLIRSNSPLKWF